MAGTLKPSTITGEEAKYTYLGGKTSAGHYNKDGSGLFNGSLTFDNTNSEGYYYNKITDSIEYVLVKTEEYCNIYAHCAFNNRIAGDPLYNYVSSATGKLKILQYDGTDYNIDVTDLYWTGKQFIYSTATVTSNELTFEQFLSTELIDRRWQKIISNLPPGQYKFVQYNDSNERHDDEWFLEKIITFSEKIKTAVVNTIKNNGLIQSHLLTMTIESEE